jgi:hypothetical protein
MVGLRDTGCHISPYVWIYLYIYPIYGLFNDSVTSSSYTASSDMMISGRWIGKDVEESGRGQICITILAFNWKY